MLVPAAECSRGPRDSNLVSGKRYQRFHLGKWGTKLPWSIQCLCLNFCVSISILNFNSLFFPYCPAEWCVRLVVAEHPYFAEVVVEAQEGRPGSSSVILCNSSAMRMSWNLSGGSSAAFSLHSPECLMCILIDVPVIHPVTKKSTYSFSVCLNVISLTGNATDRSTKIFIFLEFYNSSVDFQNIQLLFPALFPLLILVNSTDTFFFSRCDKFPITYICCAL